MSKRDYQMMYVALSPEQIERGEFSLFRLVDNRRQQKKWTFGREARFLRYDSCEWIVEMSGSMAEDAAWFLCPVIHGWTDIDFPDERADDRDLQNLIDAQEAMAEGDLVQAANRRAALDLTTRPFVEQDHWVVNPDQQAEPDIRFAPARMNVDGRPPTFEQLQDFADRVTQAPLNPDIWHGIPGPQANVTATEEAVRMQRPQYPPRVFRTGHGLGRTHHWQGGGVQVYVNEALDRWNRMANNIPGVVDRAVEMARADRAEREQATHRWEQDAAGNWVRHRITQE